MLHLFKYIYIYIYLYFIFQALCPKEDSKMIRKIAALHQKESLLEKTIALEEEEQQAEEDDKEEEERVEDETETAQSLKEKLMLVREESNRQELLNDMIKDPSIPRSLIKMMKENTGM